MTAYDKNKKLDWSVFDCVWYKEKYKDVLSFLQIETDEAVQEFYKNDGASLKHSPNPYFDED